MTWTMITDGPPVAVQAHKVTYNREPHVQLTIGTQTSFLTEGDAASLGGYLLGVTNNEDASKKDAPKEAEN